MRFSRLFLWLSLLSISALAACGGGGSGPFYPSATPGASPVAAVAFLFVVPPASTASAHRNIITTSNAVSASITLDSVNGTASTSTPTVVNLATTNSNCQQSSGQLSCLASVTVPPGALVFTVKTYTAANAGGTLIAEGNLAVTATSGATVNAPVTLTGTVAKLAVTIGPAELGNAASVPVTLQAFDANNATILGTYNEPITLTDTDATSQTTLSATSIPDSTTAAGLTLKYSGQVMASAATIAASASGISTASASFAPDNTNPTVDGSSISYSYSYTYLSYEVGQTPGPAYTYGPNTSTAQVEATPFNGVQNAFEIETPTYSGYYTWTQGNSVATLGYLGGYDDPDDSYTCNAPYSNTFEIPIPQTWNVYSGAGACTYFYLYNSASSDPTNYEAETSTYNSDGSYSDVGSYNYTSCCTNDYGSYNYATQTSGSGIATEDSPDGSFYLNLPAMGSTANVTLSLAVNPSGVFSSPTPAPTQTTAPNPYLAIGLSGEPSPLESDVFTNAGSVAASSIPASCVVPTSVMPAGSTLTHIQEKYYYADPLADDDDFYYTESNDYYYLPGVGNVCELYNESYYYYDDGPSEYYDAQDQAIDVETDSYTYYATAATGLTAASKRRALTGASLLNAEGLFHAVAHTAHMQQVQAERIKLMKRAKIHRHISNSHTGTTRRP